MSRLDIYCPADWPKLARQARFRAKPLSESLGLTPRHLQRCVRARFGTSIQAWLNAERMIAAPSLLRKLRRAKDVGALLGFNQSSHFCREFREYFGLYPSAFLAWSDRDAADNRRLRESALTAEKLRAENVFSSHVSPR